jgi:hypothetical protein
LRRGKRRSDTSLLKVVSMFIGLCLALIHLVVAFLNIFIEHNYSLGALFIVAAIGCAFGSFATIFHYIKLGMLCFIGLFFLGFFIMLYFTLILEFFSCVLAMVCIFLNILQIRSDYFAIESREGWGRLVDDRSILTGSRPDPLGFDKDFYYNKFYNIKKKKRVKKKKKKEAPPTDREGVKDEEDEVKDEKDD